MSANKYAEQIVNEFIREITDNLFLFIEQDKNRKKGYMTNLNRFGVQELHMAIGKQIKEKLNLDNEGVNNDPKSHLIKDYTYHKVK